MDNRLRAFGDAAYAARASEAHSREDWRRARAAHVGLELLGMPRANVLLVGIDGMVWNLLQTLLPALSEPVKTWCPGQALDLTASGRPGTLVLHDVGAMPLGDQLRLLKWLENGRTQIVSMTSMPLLPRVQSGAFIDTLYYRLNTVCVDVTA